MRLLIDAYLYWLGTVFAVASVIAFWMILVEIAWHLGWLSARKTKKTKRKKSKNKKHF